MTNPKTQTDLFGARGSSRAPAGRQAPRPAKAGRIVTQRDMDEHERERLTGQLQRVALIHARKLDGRPFMLANIRSIAIQNGYMTGHEGAPHPTTGRLMRPRALAWLGALLPGMARDGALEKYTIEGRVQYGESSAERAHGNKNVLWRLTPKGERIALVIKCGQMSYAEALSYVTNNP